MMTTRIAAPHFASGSYLSFGLDLQFRDANARHRTPAQKVRRVDRAKELDRANIDEDPERWDGLA